MNTYLADLNDQKKSLDHILASSEEVTIPTALSICIKSREFKEQLFLCAKARFLKNISLDAIETTFKTCVERAESILTPEGPVDLAFEEVNRVVDVTEAVELIEKIRRSIRGRLARFQRYRDTENPEDLSDAREVIEEAA